MRFQKALITLFCKTSRTRFETQKRYILRTKETFQKRVETISKRFGEVLETAFERIQKMLPCLALKFYLKS